MMKPLSEEDLSLKGLMLAAQPTLLDPNFQRSLIYLADHGDDGAFGLVVNRPTGRMLGELMSEPEQHPGIIREVPVYLGGPVEREKVLLAAFSQGKGGPDDVECRFDVRFDEVGGFIA